jgi:hypothetical protein
MTFGRFAVIVAGRDDDLAGCGAGVGRPGPRSVSPAVGDARAAESSGRWRRLRPVRNIACAHEGGDRRQAIRRKRCLDGTDTGRTLTRARWSCVLVTFEEASRSWAPSPDDADEFATHDDASIMEPAVAVPDVGTEAYLVATAPGLYEVWVKGPHGYFKVGGQSKESDIAIAKAAVGRN